MVQKKNSNLILISIIVILIIAAVAIISILSQRSKKFDSDSKTQPTTSVPQTIEQMQESENKNKLTLDEITIDYIMNKYPTSNNIQTAIDYAGLGYAIMNTTYTFNDEDVTKKIYLKQNEDSWIFLHESDDTISCATAKEISPSDSVLTLNCIE